MKKNSCRRVIAGSVALLTLLSMYPANAAAETDVSVFADAGQMALGEDVKCGDNLSWELSGDTLTISGTGAMYDMTDSDPKPWRGMESSIRNIVIGEGVTSIGAYSFDLCQNVTSVSIPSSVNYIGTYAFRNCNALETITISNGAIAENAFSPCLGLKTVNIGAGVTSIGAGAFMHCNSLATVNISDMAAWCNINFGGEYANPVQYTHKLSLNGEVVTSLGVPEGVAKIGNYAFVDNTAITNIVIPATVETIGENSFRGCTALSSVIAPQNGLKTIGSKAFQSCPSLLYFNIPASVTNIGSYSFANAPLLQVNIRKGRIGEYAFSNCGQLGSVLIGDGVTEIAANAFDNCAGITELELGFGVTSVGNGAFKGCVNLASKGYVEYGGTKESFAGIQMGEDNSCLTGAKKIVYMNRTSSIKYLW